MRRSDDQHRAIAGGEAGKVGDHDIVGAGVGRSGRRQSQRVRGLSRQGGPALAPLVGQRRASGRDDPEDDRIPRVHRLVRRTRGDRGRRPHREESREAGGHAGGVRDHDIIPAGILWIRVLQGQRVRYLARQVVTAEAPLIGQRRAPCRDHPEGHRVPGVHRLVRRVRGDRGRRPHREESREARDLARRVRDHDIIPAGILWIRVLQGQRVRYLARQVATAEAPLIRQRRAPGCDHPEGDRVPRVHRLAQRVRGDRRCPAHRQMSCVARHASRGVRDHHVVVRVVRRGDVGQGQRRRGLVWQRHAALAPLVGQLRAARHGHSEHRGVAGVHRLADQAGHRPGGELDVVEMGVLVGGGRPSRQHQTPGAGQISRLEMVQKRRSFEPDRQFARGVQIDLQRRPAEAGPGERIEW